MNVTAQLTYSHCYFLKFPHTCYVSLSFIQDNESNMKRKAIKLVPATLRRQKNDPSQNIAILQ